MKIEIDVKIPEGYEFVRFSIPKDGDFYISDDEKGLIDQATCLYPHRANRVIVKKKERVPFLFRVVKDKYPEVLDITIKEFIETVENIYEIDEDSGNYLLYLSLFEDGRTRRDVKFNISGSLEYMVDWSCYLGFNHWNGIQYRLKYKPTIYRRHSYS